MLRQAFLVSFGLLFLSLSLSFGQQRTTAPASPPQAPAPSQPSASPNGQGGANQSNNNQALNGQTLPVYVSGMVKLSNGTEPLSPVPVQIECPRGGRKSDVADAHGNFSIVLEGPGFNEGFGGCPARANLGGYESSIVEIQNRLSRDSSDIGIIYLRPIGTPEPHAYTTSITTELAPKDARKEYEHALESAKRQKWPDAQQALLKAVAIYPNYAVAWYELGRVYHEQNRLADAEHAQKQAIQIDPKFVNPFSELVALEFLQQKWSDMAKNTSEILKLVPNAGPEIHFYSAVASYNLHDIDAAQKSLIQAARLDEHHKVPRIYQLLALILASKGDFKGALDNLRTYLQLNPNAPDAGTVQQQIADLAKKTGEAR